MADVGIYTKSADIQARAGENAPAVSKAVAATDVYVLNVESLINSLTRFNWSDAFTAGLNADVGGILTEASACLCAIYVIMGDMNAYTTRIEAEDLINVNRDKALFAISILRDKKVQKFIQEA